jgi:hypothetical protein
MIKATSLLKILNYLIGQNTEIDHLNLSPVLMLTMTALFRRLKTYEVKIFDDYLIIYIKSKPVVIKSYGWKRYNAAYDMYFNSETRTFHSHFYIQLK